MDLSPILNPLNDAQREAVTAPLAPVLVLAGAGSGKTRVLIHRIAWLIQTEGVSPHSILAVTFTNKAAGEMRGRVEQLLGTPGAALWLGTFHGIANRLLRLHWREAGLPQSFQILDAEDQLRLIKRLLKAQNLDENRWVPREVQYFINKHKDEGRRPKHVQGGGDPTQLQLVKLFEQYEEACARSGVIDFAELLLRAFELWRDQPEVLRHYRARFRHVLVDEFQDTNSIQYAWIRLLVGSEGAPFVVGDDDQSIYRWRGARVENLHKFREDFPHARLYRLDSRCRQRADREQLRAAGQDAVDQWSERRAGQALRGLQRARRSRFRGHPHPRVDAARWPAPRGGDPVSLQCAIAQFRRGTDHCAHALPCLRRPALLRARRDQGCAGVSAADRQSRR
jgi:DNA helicase-2/ATP-dependent DNA helicase PcrA